MKRRTRLTLAAFSLATATVTSAVAVLSPSTAHAQDLASFEKRTTHKVLQNGLCVIVIDVDDSGDAKRRQEFLDLFLLSRRPTAADLTVHVRSPPRPPHS